MPRKPIARGESEGPPEPWASFLWALDGVLEEATTLHCIGGFVVTMQFGLSRTTSDIDILAAVPNRKLAKLERIAGRGSELHRRFKVYVQPVAIASYPEDYESRLTRMWPKLDLEHLRLVRTSWISRAQVTSTRRRSVSATSRSFVRTSLPEPRSTI